jgi:hypothetical protein
MHYCNCLHEYLFYRCPVRLIHISYLQLQCLISKLGHVFILSCRKEGTSRKNTGLFNYKLELEVSLMNAKTEGVAMCLLYGNIHESKAHNLNRRTSSSYSGSCTCIWTIFSQTLWLITTGNHRANIEKNRHVPSALDCSRFLLKLQRELY